MRFLKLKRKVAVILASTLAMTTVLTGCSSSNDGQTSGKDVFELNVCVGPEPETIDPQKNTASDGSTLINHTFEGLMN